MSKIIILLLASAANAHLLISLPSTWGLSGSLENPLNSGTTNWFCHGQSRDTNAVTTINAGSSLSVPIVCGEAIGDPQNGGRICSDDPNAYHGGGGCALSIAYTGNPDISDFYMFSVAENCPVSGQAMITFSTPANMPSGDATCAWTWIPDPNSSTDEMYMNCFNCRINGDGTGTITGGTKLEDHLWAVPGAQKGGDDRGLYKDVFSDGPLALQISGNGGTPTSSVGNQNPTTTAPNSTPTPINGNCNNRMNKNRNRKGSKGGKGNRKQKGSTRKGSGRLSAPRVH